MERYIATQFYKADSPESRILGESGLVPSEFVLATDAQRALDAEREKVKEYMTNYVPLKALEDVEAQLATLQAQLRQVEGQSKQQAEEAVIVFAKYTTLQQLLEDVLHTFGYLRFHRVAGMDGLLYETHNKMSPERTIEACEKRIRATLVAQDVPTPRRNAMNEVKRYKLLQSVCYDDGAFVIPAGQVMVTASAHDDVVQALRAENARLRQLEGELANEKTAYKKLSEQWNKDNVDLSTFREVENDMKDE